MLTWDLSSSSQAVPRGRKDFPLANADIETSARYYTILARAAACIAVASTSVVVAAAALVSTSRISSGLHEFLRLYLVLYFASICYTLLRSVIQLAAVVALSRTFCSQVSSLCGKCQKYSERRVVPRRD